MSATQENLMRYTDEFTAIDTIEKAYILGLLVSDGSATYNKQAGAYAITLKLKESDKPLLDTIQRMFPFFRMSKPEISKSGHTSYYIRHYNKQMFLDLGKLGVLPRKSYENSNNVRLPKLNDKLFFSYLHGVLDGDGTISQSKQGSIRIDVSGTNAALYQDIIDRLSTFGIKASLRFRQDKNYWMLRISSKPNVKAVVEAFSKHTLCLSRKFKPYFNADWDRVPGKDNARKEYPIWFVTT